MTGAAGLFQRAIVQSGAYAVEAGRQPTLAAAEATGTALVKAAGCADPCSLDAMRALSVDAVIAAQTMVQSSSGWVPAVDGKILPMGIGAAIKAGAYQKVPVMEGSNHDEYRLFVGLNEMSPPGSPAGPLTADNYLTAMKAVFGEQAGTALATVYSPTAYNGNPGLAQAAAGTDAIFACPSLRTAQALSAMGPVYAYEFNDPKAPQIFIPPVPDFEYGAAHASEIQYLFNLPKSVLAVDQRTLADQMVVYWTNFAKTGDPNGMGVPAWPAYTTAANGILSLAPGMPGTAVTMNFSADHKCDLISPPMP
jgi:para-nitrobenzyl esterase